MKKLSFILLLIFHTTILYPQLLINEVATGTTDDWVEIYYHNNEKSSLEISQLYITMYYGTNEKLGTEPITIYSYDRKETPYDDRYIVVHLTKPEIADETDRTGDTNHNGYIDVYCNNYFASLWNSDGVVAIDSDDDPSNGGIIDFVAYSNRDKEINNTIKSYIEHSINNNQWPVCNNKNFQECSVDIGPAGLKSFMSISRNDAADSNSINDFSITSYQTPGKKNITISLNKNQNIFRCLKKTISIIPNHNRLNNGSIPLFIFDNCNIKFRVFSINGLILYESPLYKSVPPGNFELQWDPHNRKSKTPTGLYIGRIEAVSTEHDTSKFESIFIILSKYK